MEQETEQDTAARYRVKKICIRRGWAIDQIKFEYDDEKIWSVGVDGGRKDNREFIIGNAQLPMEDLSDLVKDYQMKTGGYHKKEDKAVLSRVLFLYGTSYS